jgi:hypothetical protein
MEVTLKKSDLVLLISAINPDVYEMADLQYRGYGNISNGSLGQYWEWNFVKLANSTEQQLWDLFVELKPR